MLRRLRKTVNEVLKAYTTFGDEVFGKPRRLHQLNLFLLPRLKYSTKKVEATMQKIIGSSNGLLFPSSAKKCKTMVVAYSEDHDQGIQDHYLFRTYEHQPSHWASLVLNAGPANDIPIWKVARATSSAPLYFDSVVTEPGTGVAQKKTFFDGGLGANNPSFIALREVLQMNNPANPHTSRCLLVSIGTGLAEPGNHNHTRNYRVGLRKLLWLKDIFLNYALNSQRIHMSEVTFATEAAGIPYYRLNVDRGIDGIELDAWKPAQGGANTLETIREHTSTYLQKPQVMEWLLNCAHSLVKLRDEHRHMEEWIEFGEGFLDRWEPGHRRLHRKFSWCNRNDRDMARN
ncbi:hypothetical protein V2G26_001815 [Clonostachys chloroleuca]